MKYLVAILILICTLSASADEVIHIAVREDFLLSKLYVDILKEAYRKIDTKVEFVYLPGGSSLKFSNAGQLHLDGEAGRLIHVTRKYENLVKVNVPIFISNISVFTNRPDLNDVEWKELKKYYTTTRIGLLMVVDKLKSGKLKLVDSTDSAMLLVEKKRIDAAVLIKEDGQEATSRLGLKTVRMLDKPLQRIAVYHMLHKRHEKLIGKLEKALQEMEQSGRLDSIQSEFWKKYK